MKTKLAIIGFLCGILSGCQSSVISEPLVQEVLLTTQNAQYHDIIAESFAQYPDYQDQSTFKIGITSHHLPVASQLVTSFWQHLIATNSMAPTYVVIGPDHTEKCLNHVTSGNITYQTGFGLLESNTNIVHALAEAGIDTSGQCLENEHSIGVQADYIRHLFPDAKIVAISLSATTPVQSLEQIVDVLREFEDQITVITSIDFNHYRTADQAGKYDSQTRTMIQNLDASKAEIDNVDSPTSLQLTFMLAKAFNHPKPIILEELNSYQITGSFENTTGYFNVGFVR